MKDFISKFFFMIIAAIVVLFLFVIVYKTLSTGEIIEKSKYEDKVVNKVNETVDEVKKETTDTINKITKKNEFGLDESGVQTVKVLAEKSLSSINTAYDKFSNYCGYFIGTDANIYMFYISENSEYGTLSLEDRNRLMLLNSKRVGSVEQDDFSEIKRLIKKIKISYDEKENEVNPESMYDNTKMLAVYDYIRNERISVTEEGKFSVINTSSQTESLQYLIGKYLKYYMVSYDEFKNYK